MMKKSFVALVLAAAIAVPMFTDHQITPAEARPAPMHRHAELVAPQVREANELKNISEHFGTELADLKQYYDIGWGFKDLKHAAFLSYASGKDIGDILDLRAADKWPRIEYKLGLTPDDIKTAHDKCDAHYLKVKLSLDYDTAYALLQKNYSMGDVMHAVLLSTYTDVTAENIITMHNPPVKDWDAVAAELGVTSAQMEELRTKMADVRP